MTPERRITEALATSSPEALHAYTHDAQFHAALDLLGKMIVPMVKGLVADAEVRAEDLKAAIRAVEVRGLPQ